MSNKGSTSLSLSDNTSQRNVKRGRGRPVGDRESRKADLLSAAIAVTAEEGYSGVSLRKVAKRMGATTGTVTYYYANKEEMIAAVAEELFRRFHVSLNLNDENTDIKSMLDKLLNWPESEYSVLWLAFVQLLAHARQEPAFASVIQRNYLVVKDVLTALVERGQANQTIRDDISAELIADQLSALADGWMVMMPLDPERFSPERTQLLSESVLTLIKPIK